jgi:hypothetical protein
MAAYSHLTEHGALVKIGDRVEAGQPIGLSGNSGNTGGLPHLHFHLCACSEPVNCGTLPVTFRNTEANPNGLTAHRHYRALPYARPDDSSESETFVTRLYITRMLHDAAAAQSAGGDPLAEAKTPEQRRFLTEYYRVLREDRDAVLSDRTYLYMEPLRRCGFTFPEGTKVILIPATGRLLVIHTPAAIKEMEAVMGLTPER